jgi:hypothetical protein
MYKFSVSTDFTEQIMPILWILCYNGSLVIWMILSVITAKFKPLIFSMFILMTMHDFFLSPAQFYYIIVHIREVESSVQIADRRALWKISNGAQKFVLHALQF